VAGFEPPVIGKGPERGVPEDAPADAAVADGARAIVQVLGRVTAEVGEGLLMGVEELGQPLVRTAVIVAAPAEAQREDEDVAHLEPGAKGHGGRPPVDLTLLAGRRLEPDHRPLGAELGRAQRLHEELHCVVAAGIAALSQFLEEHLGREPDPRGPLPKILRVGGEQRIRARRAPVALPLGGAQTPPHRLAIEIQPPGDLGDRHPVLNPQSANLLPPFLADHRHLLVWGDLRSDRPELRCVFEQHFSLLSMRRGGEFSVPPSGDF